MSDMTDEQIINEAPNTAVTYCLYDYGDSVEGMYLNCEKQFFDPDNKQWVDMDLLDDYYHSHRRLGDITNLQQAKAEIERLIKHSATLGIELRDGYNADASTESFFSLPDHLQTAINEETERQEALQQEGSE